MAIKKIKWEELMPKILPTRLDSSLQALASVITEVNNMQVSVIGASNIAVIYNEVMIALCRDNNNPSQWKDLTIFVSSFKENDCRFTELLIQKLLEYAEFYKKILTDSGIQRALSYGKTYTNNGSSSSQERGTESVTPQNSNLYDSEHPESDALFDQAIADFASGINKNKTSVTSSNYGGSTTLVTGTTWEEQRKNLQMLFYNELCDYMMSLPEKIYSYYSIGTIPAPELAKFMSQHIKEVMEMFTSDE